MWNANFMTRIWRSFQSTSHQALSYHCIRCLVMVDICMVWSWQRDGWLPTFISSWTNTSLEMTGVTIPRRVATPWDHSQEVEGIAIIWTILLVMIANRSHAWHLEAISVEGFSILVNGQASVIHSSAYCPLFPETTSVLDRASATPDIVISSTCPTFWKERLDLSLISPYLIRSQYRNRNNTHIVMLTKAGKTLPFRSRFSHVHEIGTTETPDLHYLFIILPIVSSSKSLDMDHGQLQQ